MTAIPIFFSIVTSESKNSFSSASKINNRLGNINFKVSLIDQIKHYLKWINYNDPLSSQSVFP